MIQALLAALAVAGQAAPPPTPAGDDDIVVIGERLKNLQIVTRKDRRIGVRRCMIEPSSGDAILDAGICETYTACAAQVDTATALRACMTPPLATLVAAYRDRRRPVR